MDIGGRIRSERLARQWSLEDLAGRADVSRAMLSRIERRESSPTAELLVRIAAAFGMTLSALIARAEGEGAIARRADQPRWVDPATGYERRHLSPPDEIAVDLVEVVLPAGAEVAFPSSAYAFSGHLIWLIDGRLDFHEGAVVHRLEAGDCLRLGQAADCRYGAPGPHDAHYLVAVRKV